MTLKAFPSTNVDKADEFSCFNKRLKLYLNQQGIMYQDITIVLMNCYVKYVSK